MNIKWSESASASAFRDKQSEKLIEAWQVHLG